MLSSTIVISSYAQTKSDAIKIEKMKSKALQIVESKSKNIQEMVDMVFSFDSIITAGGTAKRIEIMIAAVVLAMVVMFLFSGRISSFIHKHPTLKMLALSFLVMIGLSLVIEGWDSEQAHELHLKNYILNINYDTHVIEIYIPGKFEYFGGEFLKTNFFNVFGMIPKL